MLCPILIDTYPIISSDSGIISLEPTYSTLLSGSASYSLTAGGPGGKPVSDEDVVCDGVIHHITSITIWCTTGYQPKIACLMVYLLNLDL